MNLWKWYTMPLNGVSIPSDISARCLPTIMGKGYNPSDDTSNTILGTIIWGSHKKVSWMGIKPTTGAQCKATILTTKPRVRDLHMWRTNTPIYMSTTSQRITCIRTHLARYSVTPNRRINYYLIRCQISCYGGKFLAENVVTGAILRRDRGTLQWTVA